MPLYEYACKTCDKTNELLVRGGDEQPQCPSCGSDDIEKLLSLAAAPAIAGGSLPTVAAGGNCGRPQCGSGCMFE